MLSADVIKKLQSLKLPWPGAVAWKRALHNDAAACGVTYRGLTAGRKDEFAIITYHRVLEKPDPDYGFAFGIRLSVFERQLAMFHRFGSVRPLDEILDRIEQGKPLPPRCIALTFDDGYRDVLTRAWPLLLRYKLPATLYVAVDALERGFLWPDVVQAAIQRTRSNHLVLEALKASPPRAFEFSDPRQRLMAVWRLNALLTDLSNEKKQELLRELTWKLLRVSPEEIPFPGLMLTWEELKELAAGGMTIGAHTVSHPILTRVSQEQAQQEILQSRQLLEERVGIPVRHFCYPNGRAQDFSPEIERMVEASGYRSACTTIRGINTLRSDRFALRRIHGEQKSVRELVRVLAEEAIAA